MGLLSIVVQQYCRAQQLTDLFCYVFIIAIRKFHAPVCYAKQLRGSDFHYKRAIADDIYLIYNADTPPLV